MHAAELEAILDREWAVRRADVIDAFQIAPLHSLRGRQAVRPSKALEILGATPERMFDLLRTGRLPRPAKFGGGRVAWRADEVLRLAADLREDDD